MDNIKLSLEYIEQNLKSDISADELAEMTGYSVWHYHRLFAKATGMTIASYIGKRRLDRALNEIISGRRLIDVAMDYGFDTYAGFYKAFVRTYGDSPKSYLSKKEASAMFTEKEIRGILTNWDIPQDLPILDIYIMDGAAISENVWSIGENYILKTEKRENMLNNLKIARALSKQGFASAMPILTKSGDEYLDGENITLLTSGIKGAPLAKEYRFGKDRQLFGIKYGESIARLHRSLEVIESDIKPSEINQYKSVIEWALPETRKQNIQYNIGLPDSFFDDYIYNFGALFDKLPKQLIHRDPNPSNILFDNGEVTGFVDFDLSHRNIRLFDPCYCATGLLAERLGLGDNDGLAYDVWPEILRGILSGYDSVNPLTAEEKQAVYYVICSIQMVFIAYCEQQLELEFAKISRVMLKYIANNKEQIIATINESFEN
ncbi:MAG: helix-turn-helix domain-containing protein [Oscillospiraceae bacterium]|nr:helix-turn-helix domain-containing protein [Oscillospiraceae bacterium]